MLACLAGQSAGIQRYMAASLAQSSSCHIHGRIAHADDRHMITQIIGIRICQIINRKVYISQRLTFDSQRFRSPYTGSDENALVTIPEQILDLQRAADGGVRADLNTDLAQFVLIPLQNRLRQTERRNTVLQHTADLIPGIKDRHAIALLRQQNGDGNTCRASTDHSNLLAILRLARNLHFIKISIGNIILNAADMHRLPLAAQHAMPLTLVLMVADQGTDHGHGIVLKQHLPRLI